MSVRVVCRLRETAATGDCVNMFKSWLFPALGAPTKATSIRRRCFLRLECQSSGVLPEEEVGMNLPDAFVGAADAEVGMEVDELSHRLWSML